MSKTELLIRLRDLHEELSGINVDLKSAEQVDDDTIDALGQLASDVAALVDQASERVDEQPVTDEQRVLQDRIEEFESGHPKVTSFLSQLTDLLVMLGI